MTVSGRALDFVKGIDATYPKILTVFFTVAVVYPAESHLNLCLVDSFKHKNV